MPTELNRIRELSGLQQEAPAKESWHPGEGSAEELAKEIWNNTPAYHDEYKDWQEYMNSEDFELDADKLRSKFGMESSVSEEPAPESMPTLQIQKDTAELLFKEVPEYRKKYKTVQNFMQSQEFRDHLDRYWHKPKNIVKQRDQGLDKDIAKMYKDWVDVINDTSGNPDDIESDYNWGYGEDDDREARALAAAFNTSLEAGLQSVKKIKIEREKANREGDSREGDWDPFHPQSERHDELKAMFAKYGEKLPETAVQPEPVLNAVKETSVTSQVDEAIKKARAQLKSFSNFDGLKPYKPKKK